MKHFRTEYNSDLGITHDYYWDDVEQKMVVRNRHDVGDIIESNKRQQNNTIDSRYGDEMMHHVADIPMAVVMKWKTEHGCDILSNDPSDMKKARKLLNLPEYRYLKRTVKKL